MAAGGAWLTSFIASKSEMLRNHTSHAVMSSIVAPAACTMDWMSCIAYLVSFATPPCTRAGPPGAVKSTPWLPETFSSQWFHSFPLQKQLRTPSLNGNGRSGQPGTLTAARLGTSDGRATSENI